MKKLFLGILMISLCSLFIFCGCSQGNDDPQPVEKSEKKVTESAQVRYNNLLNGGKAAYGTDGKIYFAVSEEGRTDSGSVWSIRDAIKVYDPENSESNTLLSVNGNSTFSNLTFRDDALYAVQYDRDNKKSCLIKIDIADGSTEEVFSSGGYIYGNDIYTSNWQDGTISKTKLNSPNEKSDTILEDINRFYGIYEGILIYSNTDYIICGYQLDTKATIEYGKGFSVACPCVYDDQIYFLDGNGIASGGESRYGVTDTPFNAYNILTGAKKTVISKFNGRGPKMTITAEGNLYCDGNDGMNVFDLKADDSQGESWPSSGIKNSMGYQMGFYDLGDWIGVYNLSSTNKAQDSKNDETSADIDFCLINKESGTAIAIY